MPVAKNQLSFKRAVHKLLSNAPHPIAALLLLMTRTEDTLYAPSAALALIKRRRINRTAVRSISMAESSSAATAATAKLTGCFVCRTATPNLRTRFLISTTPTEFDGFTGCPTVAFCAWKYVNVCSACYDAHKDPVETQEDAEAVGPDYPMKMNRIGFCKATPL